MATPEQLRAVLLTPEEAAAMDAPGRVDAAVLVPRDLHDGDLHARTSRTRTCA
jgi:hypothetical protein